MVDLAKYYEEQRTGRRIRNGRVEFLFECPNLFHGMEGPCSICDGHPTMWRRPSPRPPFSRLVRVRRA